MVLGLAMLRPRGEVSHLTVVPVVGQPHLGSNQNDLAMIYDDTAVINHVLVGNRPVGHILS